MFGRRKDQTFQARLTLPELHDFEAELRRRGGDVHNTLRAMRPDLAKKAPGNADMGWVRSNWNDWDLTINVEVSGLVLW